MLFCPSYQALGDMRKEALKRRLLENEFNNREKEGQIFFFLFLGVTLPYYQSLPGMKAIRPVTTFDLQTIRQHMQQSWLHGNKDRFELAQARDKLQKELLQLWYYFFFKYFLCISRFRLLAIE